MFFLIKWYEQWREVRRCESCETLREQLAIANGDRERLLKAILDANKPVAAVSEPETHSETIAPILPKNVPWRVRREMLENEDRAKAEILRKKELEIKEATKSTEELEKELGIEHAS